MKKVLFIALGIVAVDLAPNVASSQVDEICTIVAVEKCVTPDPVCNTTCADVNDGTTCSRECSDQEAVCTTSKERNCSQPAAANWGDAVKQMRALAGMAANDGRCQQGEFKKKVYNEVDEEIGYFCEKYNWDGNFQRGIKVGSGIERCLMLEGKAQENCVLGRIEIDPKRILIDPGWADQQLLLERLLANPGFN